MSGECYKRIFDTFWSIFLNNNFLVEKIFQNSRFFDFFIFVLPQKIQERKDLREKLKFY